MAIGFEKAAVEDFRKALRGAVLAPEDRGYDEARRLYNAMFDKRPGVIARCADVADVMAAVKLARARHVEVAIRGGGHNGAGFASVDGGLVIDLRGMKGIRIDPRARTATVEGGALLGDLDHAAHAFGLATPAGIISTTGVAGLTLGGGHGYLTRKYGLTIDNLLSADVVLADGSFVTASEAEHEDLFWALRGGGGNFGVVTSFTLRLHPVTTVIAGPTLWPLEAAGDVLRWYRDFLPAAPDDVFGFFAFLTVPPAPPFPAELHGKKMCGIVWCYTGPKERASDVFAPALRAAKPALHGVHEAPYPALQRAFDALYPAGDQWYWRGDFAKEIPDAAVARHLEFAAALPTMQSSMHLYPIDGAVHRAPKDATAFSYRDATFSQVIVGVDHDPARAAALRSWVVEYWEALHPYSAGGAYVNFMMDEGQERIQATYRDNYARLARVKARYDPDNVFHMNQNVRPAR
jgi:FAD/FMN-containing dehydrogenase